LVASFNVAAANLLEDDDFGLAEETFDAPVEERWYDKLKLTLEHSQTVTNVSTTHQRSSLRGLYENQLGESGYVYIDGRYQYLWHNDYLIAQDLSKDGGEWEERLTQAWVQYSYGRCAAKVGKQHVFWGEVEGAFVTDVISPFDYTEQLLTDFANIRRAQSLALADCYIDDHRWQVFYNPKAHFDRFPIAQFSTASLGAEYGVNYEYSFSGGDVSLMVAHLYPNTPSLVSVSNTEIIAEPYTMIGLGSSIASGRLLYKFDLAFKDRQHVNFVSQPTKRIDAALGIEYTTPDNHFFNAGVWGRYELDDIESETSESPILTLGWSKSYWHDNLAMSLLGNYADEPSYTSVTLQADYQWNDYISFLVALGWACLPEEAEFLPIAQQERSGSYSVKVEF
jgi:hypothetical protein